MNRTFSDTGCDGTREPRAGRFLDREHVRAWAREAGFAEAGIVAIPYADEERDAGRFEEWVKAGRAGTMNYLKRTGMSREQDAGRASGLSAGPGPGGENGPLVRTRMGIPFPWARSAIACFAGYDSAQPRSIDPAKQEEGWIARYAWSGRRDAGGP